jgi:hypothetical protein
VSGGEIRGSQVNKLIEVTVVNRVNSAHTWLLLGNIFIISGSKWSGLEIWEYGFGDPLRWPRDTFYQQKLVLTLVTSGGRSVGIVRSRTKATEFLYCFGFYQEYVEHGNQLWMPEWRKY